MYTARDEHLMVQDRAGDAARGCRLRWSAQLVLQHVLAYY